MQSFHESKTMRELTSEELAYVSGGTTVAGLDLGGLVSGLLGTVTGLLSSVLSAVTGLLGGLLGGL